MCSALNRSAMTQFLSIAMCTQAPAGPRAAIAIGGDLQVRCLNAVAPPGAGVS
jgi:hypothetical protein